jgi:chemotaxis protein methyltransferase CheR
MTFLPVSQPAPPEQELALPDFQAIAAIALREFGLSLPVSKRQLVQSRLARRLRTLDLQGFGAYRALLESEGGAQELPMLLSALTTNVTRFFREIHHFDLLLDQVMPALVARARAGERVRIWSAACSSGQEPYSIALTALKIDPGIGRCNFKILATDIDPVIVEKARRAQYNAQEIAGISQRYFRPADVVHRPNGIEGTFTLAPEVKDLITFGVLNLIAEPPFSGPFDVIFCRNVAIYFDRPTQQRVWRRLSGLLSRRGMLFIGHSERIPKTDCPELETAGITVYQKT